MFVYFGVDFFKRERKRKRGRDRNFGWSKLKFGFFVVFLLFIFEKSLRVCWEGFLLRFGFLGADKVESVG